MEKKSPENTRDALIAAGLELFSEYGFKATSTRMIAEESGANISAIPYYFGSKQGLYHAVMEYIVEQKVLQTSELRTQLEAELAAGTITADKARTWVARMLSHMLKIYLSSDEAHSWMQLVMREQARPTAAFDIIYDGYILPMQHLCAQLVACCTGGDPEDDLVKLRGNALFGQVLIFIVSNEAVIRNIGVSKLSEEHIELMQRMLTAHVEASLQAEVPQ